MGKIEVYEAILRRIQATELTQQSNAVLHEELEQVKQAVAQLDAAMARIREVQTAMRRLTRDVPVSNSSPEFQELLKTIQTMQNQIATAVDKLVWPLLVHDPCMRADVGLSLVSNRRSWEECHLCAVISRRALWRQPASLRIHHRPSKQQH